MDGQIDGTYPGVVEFSLEGDVFAFFFVLGAQDLQFSGLERAVLIERVRFFVLAAGVFEGGVVRTLPRLRRLLR